jgi:hypothetical protein
MELNRLKLLTLLTTLVFMVPALSARASTISITGGAGWVQANSYGVDFSGAGLALSAGSCDATGTQPWTGPFTFSAGSLGYGCTEGSASYGAYMWTASYISAAPDEIDAGVTGIPGACGRMVVSPDGTWSESCIVSISGTFDAFPQPGPGPSLSGTITGSGTVDFSGYQGFVASYVDSYSASFAGTAGVTSPVPEPGSLSLVILGGAALLALALRRMPAC